MEAGVGCEFAAVLEDVFANVDLGETRRTRREAAVAEFAQLAATADRHRGQNFTFLEIGVKGDRAVAQLTLD